MSLMQKLYEARLTGFAEKVRREPDADLMPAIREIAAAVTEAEKIGLQQLVIAVETLLSDFKEEVRRDPDADFTQKIRELADTLIRRKRYREQRVINTLLLGLYENDARSLRRDITKIITLGTAKATPAQRVELLRCLCEGLSLHTKEDFSGILEECGRLEGDEK